ncbi:dTDP-4-amino-4,6-dideoxygalactose transaminase [Thiothrix unzii]|uniref:dTDP-4-amino-4,6-dideoxygalactose transaminase n=1 Tax=Thiothrix unzii TaxID=111769 RepID=A0A975IH98_9GAMM|nr:dTDP-4-amino-4,6-dideoxygalactose transaminase [Thiothrix unzii]QTR53479.1 dTDP-4-amino-4,6-dideoxygalactose transaminase [Thiothrix unzii]
MIPFNRPPLTGNEAKYVLQAIQSEKISGDGQFTLKCHAWFEEKLSCAKALLTPSCTHALEMAALLLDVKPGDEIIMPSYTFVSTANAFALRGATIVFVDIRPDTLNINENLIEQAITSRTKAIVVVHYAGISCEMNTIMSIAIKYKLFVIEDAAQGMMSTYDGKPLGTFGNMATYSFHETKNYTSGGEGGLLIINDPEFVSRAEIIREKGTNRKQFFQGIVDKYTWVDIGSSLLPSELQAAYLWGQLEECENILSNRMKTWNSYHSALSELEEDGYLRLPSVPKECKHNAHMFYIQTEHRETRTKLLEKFKEQSILAIFHYIPLHSTMAGIKYGRFNGEDQYTTKASQCIIRLPLFYGLQKNQLNKITSTIVNFYHDAIATTS